MESKHTFFKRAARSSQNYINITKTLSEAHELYCTFMLTTATDLNSIELQDSVVDFNADLFAYNVSRAIMSNCFLSKPFQCSFCIKIKETLYESDYHIILRCEESTLWFGKIILCVQNSQHIPAFVVKLFHGHQNQTLG